MTCRHSTITCAKKGGKKKKKQGDAEPEQVCADPAGAADCHCHMLVLLRLP